MKISRLYENKFVYIFSITAVIFTLYYRLIFSAEILSRDDSSLINTLKKVLSVSHYFQLFLQKKLIDIQPIRDLSFFLDFLLENIVGFQTYHLTNIILFVFIIILSKKILILFDIPRFYAISFSILLAVHPIFVGSVGWISARKHLLSCAFILLATICSMSKSKLNRKKIVLTTCLYVLSILSQPITLLWPLWILFRGYINKSRALLGLTLLCTPFLILVFYFNITYYAFMKTNQTPLLYRISNYPLALGRSFYQFFIPVSYSADYYQGAIANIIGLVLLFILLVIYFKVVPRKTFISNLIFLLFTIILSFQYFMYDTYLLVPALGYTIILTSLLSLVQIKKKIFLPFFIIVFCFLALTTWKTVPMWFNDFSLWETSFLNEPTPYVAEQYGQLLIKINPNDAFEKASFVLGNFTRFPPGIPTLYSKSLYFHTKYTIDQKITLINHYQILDPWYQFFKGMIYYKAKRYNQALIIHIDNLQNYKVFHEKSQMVFNLVSKLCLKHYIDKCLEIEKYRLMAKQDELIQ